MGLLTGIAIALHAIGTTFGKVWDVIRQFLTWLLSVMPGPLKFFFFLYIILFMTSLIIPVFLGAKFDCDSQGNIYEINAFEVYFNRIYIDRAVDLCEEAATEGKISVFSWVKYFFTDYVISTPFRAIFGIPAVLDLVPMISGGNVTTEDICYEYEQFSQGNITKFDSRDFTLNMLGEKLEQRGYEQVIHVGCGQKKDGSYYQTLQFFDIDLFNFEMWLLIGLLGALSPFVFKWYRIIIKR